MQLIMVWMLLLFAQPARSFFCVSRGIQFSIVRGDGEMRTIVRNMIHSTVLLAGIAACLFPGSAPAVQEGIKITFNGGGAGVVVFDGTVHAKELKCADCHETRFLSPALYGMNRSPFEVSMRKMEMGKSCGRCHDVTSDRSCSACHHK